MDPLSQTFVHVIDEVVPQPPPRTRAYTKDVLAQAIDSKATEKVALLEISEDGLKLMAYAPNNATTPDVDDAAFVAATRISLDNTFRWHNRVIPGRILIDDPFMYNPVAIVEPFNAHLSLHDKDRVYLKVSNLAELVTQEDVVLITYDEEKSKFVTMSMTRRNFETFFDYSAKPMIIPDTLSTFMAELTRVFDGEVDELLNRSLAAKGDQIEAIARSMKHDTMDRRIPQMFSDNHHAVRNLFVKYDIYSAEKMAQAKEFFDKQAKGESTASDVDDPFLHMRTSLIAVDVMKKYIDFATTYADLREGKILPPPRLRDLPQNAGMLEKIQWAETLYGAPFESGIGDHRSTFNREFHTLKFEAYTTAIDAALEQGAFDPEKCRAEARRLFVEKHGDAIPEKFMTEFFESDWAKGYPTQHLSHVIAWNPQELEKFDTDQREQIIRDWVVHAFTAPYDAEKVKDHIDNQQYASLLDRYGYRNEQARQIIAEHLSIPYAPYKKPTPQQQEDRFNDTARAVANKIGAMFTAPSVT